MTPSYHLRRTHNAMQITHYVSNRTLLTLCGVSAINWPLDLERAAPTCDKCIKYLDTQTKTETQQNG